MMNVLKVLVCHQESTLGTWTCWVEADDSLEVVQESVTVEVTELPDLPNESVFLSNTSFEEGTVGHLMAVCRFKSAKE